MTANRIFLLAAVILVSAVFFGLAYRTGPSSPVSSSSPVVVDAGQLVKPHSPVKGSPEAKITIVEFLDPECESCRLMHPIVKRLLQEYEGKVRLVIRYMPYHGNSYWAAAALEEARELGKFDQALDILFEKQPEWGDHHQPRPELIAVYLKQIGIPEKNLGRDYLLGKHKWKVDADYADGNILGVRGTPTFFVNGVLLPEIGYAPLKQAIDQASGR